MRLTQTSGLYRTSLPASFSGYFSPETFGLPLSSLVNPRYYLLRIGILTITNLWGQTDANECVGDEIGSGYLRGPQAGLANSSPTLRICSTGLECGVPL